MSITVVKPDEFFLEKSFQSKHPNFKAAAKKYLNKNIPQEDSVSAKGGKGNLYRYTKTGYREDIGINVRSNWEANFARLALIYKIDFEFEPKVFTYPIKRGTKSYTPDFYFNKTQEWIEIKGYLDEKSKIKIKRFKRYYPEEFSKFTMIISRYSTEAKKFVEELEVPNVIFYEDIRDYYFELIYKWEGK